MKFQQHFKMILSLKNQQKVENKLKQVRNYQTTAVKLKFKRNRQCLMTKVRMII